MDPRPAVDVEAEARAAVQRQLDEMHERDRVRMEQEARELRESETLWGKLKRWLGLA